MMRQSVSYADLLTRVQTLETALRQSRQVERAYAARIATLESSNRAAWSLSMDRLRARPTNGHEVVEGVSL